MANMNFSIAVKLIEQGVTQGANRIKASLRSIQFQALAMASALSGGVSSLGDLMRTLVDTARETNRVQTALKNVSGSLGEYGSNLQYLKHLTSEYGLELNGTTSAFTKFTAAATASGMAMSDQQKVFTAVSRSITAFGLSGQEATLTFYAISQMMAKGKISAEELRRQLGERMPIAMEAMQRAAQKLGFKENLDDLLKAGKLRSLDILPQFAEELNNLVIKVDTDNAETSVNRLKNSFIGLTEDWDIAGKFKVIVDKVRGFIDDLRQSVSLLYGVLGGAALGKAFNMLRQGANGLQQNAKNGWWRDARRVITERNQAQEVERSSASTLQGAEDKHRISTQTTLNRLKAEEQRIDARIASARQAYATAQLNAQRLEDAHNQRRLAKEQQIQALRDKSRKAYDADMASRPAGSRTPSYDTWLKRRKDAEAKLKQELQQLEIKHAERVDAVNRSVTQKKLRLDAVERQSTIDKGNAQRVANERISASEAKLNRVKALNVQATQNLGRATSHVERVKQLATNRMALLWRGVGTAIKSVALSIKSMLASFLPMLIIGSIISIITKINEMKEMWEKTQKAQEDFQAGVATATSSEADKLQGLIGLLKERLKKEEDITAEKKALNAYLGTEISDTNTLIEQAEERLKLEKEIARVKFAEQKKLEAQYKIEEINARRKAQGKHPYTKEDAQAYRLVGGTVKGTIRSWTSPDKWGRDSKDISTPYKSDEELKETYKQLSSYSNGYHKSFEDYKKEQTFETMIRRRAMGESINEQAQDLSALSEAHITIDAADVFMKGASDEAKREAYGVTGNNATTPTTPRVDKDPSKAKETPLQRSERQYEEEKAKILNQHKQGLISETALQERLYRLSKETRLEIGGILGDKAKDNKTFKDAETLYNEHKDSFEQSPERDALKNYDKEASALSSQLARGVINTADYNEAMRKLIDGIIKSLGAMPNLSQDGQSKLEDFKTQRQQGGKFADELPQLKQRDTSLDYKKSRSETLKEDLDNVKEWKSRLEEASTSVNDLSALIEEARSQELDLGKQLKLSQVQEDIDKLQKSLQKGLFGAVKDVTQAVRGLGNSFKSLKSTFEDKDASAFEKIFAGIEAGLGAFDTINSLINSFEDMKQAREQLAKAEQAYGAVQLATGQQAIAIKQEETAVDTASTATQMTNLATSQAGVIADSAVKKAVATTNIVANQAEATSNVAKGVSALPFPANLIALVPAVASIVAIFASLPKFANGGIVPGNSRSGDKVLAGVNSGELILNEAQQHNIASKLLRNKDSISVDVNIRERLRGRDLMRSVKRAERQHKR